MPYKAMPSFRSVQDSHVLISRDMSTGHMTWCLLVHLKWIQGTAWLGYKTQVPKVADTCIFGNLWPLSGISRKVPTFTLVGHIWKLVKNWLQEIRVLRSHTKFWHDHGISGSKLIILHLFWSKWSYLTIFEKKIYSKWLAPHNFWAHKVQICPQQSWVNIILFLTLDLHGPCLWHPISVLTSNPLLW